MSSEKVEIEALPNPNYTPLSPNKPIYANCVVQLSCGRPRCQKVWGYREIFLKRQKINFLHLLIEDTLNLSIIGKGKGKEAEHKSKSVDNCCGTCNCSFNSPSLSSPTTATATQAKLYLASGGGRGGAGKDDWRPKPFLDKPSRPRPRNGSRLGNNPPLGTQYQTQQQQQQQQRQRQSTLSENSNENIPARFLQPQYWDRGRPRRSSPGPNSNPNPNRTRSPSQDRDRDRDRDPRSRRYSNNNAPDNEDEEYIEMATDLQNGNNNNNTDSHEAVSEPDEPPRWGPGHRAGVPMSTMKKPFTEIEIPDGFKIKRKIKKRRDEADVDEKDENQLDETKSMTDTELKFALEKASEFSIVPHCRDKMEIDYEDQEENIDYKYIKYVEHKRNSAIHRGRQIVHQLSRQSHLMLVQVEGRNNIRDNEWLQLSASTDHEAEREDIQLRRALCTHHEISMTKTINYGSQKLFYALNFFFCLLSVTGQNPFSIIPCNRNQIIMVHIFRWRMILHLTSTTVLWIAIFAISSNYFDLHFRDPEEGDFYKEMEKNELKLYTIFFWGFFINIFLAAFWSFLVIWNYGIMIANYYNIWSKAMPLLDMNPAPGIANNIRGHVIGYVIYAGIMSTSFYYDWPMVTRGICGQIFILISRSKWAGIRLADRDKFFWAQLGAFLLYLYCIWVNRVIFMYLHQFSLILRNACQAWNLLFAIRFQIVTTNYRAHLVRIGSQVSLYGLYQQHRIIVRLCDYYGKVFIHPLFIYMVTNMGVVTTIMIFFIKYEEIDPATFDYNFLVTLKNSNAVIYHTLPKQHELTAVAFLLLQCCVDFFQGTIGISWGTEAIISSFEFVRRQGLVLCNTRHERRLVHSLLLSFSETRTPSITADQYFAITRRQIFAGLMMMAFFWTMVIQLQVESPSGIIEWISKKSPRCEGLRLYEDLRGEFYCMLSHKFRNKIKRRLHKKRMDIVTKALASYDESKYWFFEDCYNSEFHDAEAIITVYDIGACKVLFPNRAGEKLVKKYYRHVNKQWFGYYRKSWERHKKQWRVENSAIYTTSTAFPCSADEPKFTWQQYYRDLFRFCYSKVYGMNIIVPIIFEEKGLKKHARAAAYKPDAEEAKAMDCAANPFGLIATQIENLVDTPIKYRTCNGSELDFDDCGSPRVHDFYLHKTDGTVKFDLPRLRSFTLTLYEDQLPENYEIAGFKLTATIKCWKSFGAKRKCTDRDFLKYCRVSKYPGDVTTTGYLYGKDCYDFKHFTVFVKPDEYHFCLHPIPQKKPQAFYTILNLNSNSNRKAEKGKGRQNTAKRVKREELRFDFIDKETYDVSVRPFHRPPEGNITTEDPHNFVTERSVIKETLPDLEEPDESEVGTGVAGVPPSLDSNDTAVPGVGVTIKPDQPCNPPCSSNFTAQGNGTGDDPDDDVGGVKFVTSTKRKREIRINVKSKRLPYRKNMTRRTETQHTRRHLVGDRFFPCFSLDNFMAYLPLPQVKVIEPLHIDPAKNLRLITEDELTAARNKSVSGDGKICWSNPYPKKAFKKGNKFQIEDMYGNEFLDDCFTPWWWDSDGDSFIPDDVFNMPPKYKVAVPYTGPNKVQETRRCWDTNDAIERCVDMKGCKSVVEAKSLEFPDSDFQ